MSPFIIGVLVGGLVGLVMMTVLALGRSSRDTVVFRSPLDVRQVVRGWADHYDYRPMDGGPTLHLKRGRGLLTAATHLTLEQRGDEYRLQCWVPFAGVGAKRELALTDPRWMARVPRKRARTEVDSLLAALGLPALRPS